MYTIEDLKKDLINNDLSGFLEKVNNSNVNQFDQFGNNILHFYILNIKNIKISAKQLLPELIKRGLDISAKQTKKDQRTALYLSVFDQSEELVNLLIGMGADIDSQDRNGNTPLWEAVMSSRGDDYFIKLLLSKGADPNLENMHGVSPVKLANTIANYDLKKFFK